MDAKDRMIELFNNHKGELVINNYKIVQLIGIGRDESDLYYILNDGKIVYFVTGVDWVEPIKNKVDDRYYQHMIRHCSNFYNSSYEFGSFSKMDKPLKDDIIVWVDKYRSTCIENIIKDGTNELLTDICWDIK